MALPLTVIDTTVMIDILRGHAPAIDWASTVPRRLVGSEISRVETIRGLRSRERTEAERLFSSLRWLAIDESIARNAGEMGRRWRRRHRSIGTGDLVIAATAMKLGAPLATSNVRHYPMFPQLAPPY